MTRHLSHYQTPIYQPPDSYNQSDQSHLSDQSDQSDQSFYTDVSSAFPSVFISQQEFQQAIDLLNEAIRLHNEEFNQPLLVEVELGNPLGYSASLPQLLISNSNFLILNRTFDVLAVVSSARQAHSRSGQYLWPHKSVVFRYCVFAAKDIHFVPLRGGHSNTLV